MKLLKVLAGNRRTYFLSLAILFIAALLVLPHISRAEYIESYDVTVDLKKDSSFIVTERVEYDFGSEYRHGIYRDILTKHPDDASAWYMERYLDITVTDVRVDDGPVPFNVDDSREQVSIKIGDPDKTITGVHIYKIAYEVKGGLSYLKNKDAEIYWNATGNSWEIPMKRTSVSIIDRDGILLGPNSCYLGGEGGTASCGNALVEGNKFTYSTGPLAPEEGVTVAFAIDQNKVPRVILERVSLGILFGTIIPLGLLIGVIFAYRYRTRYKTGRPIIAQYEPYEGFEPMYTGVLLDDTLDPKDITAGIVYLAEQGFLKISKIDRKVLFFIEVDDYEIKLLKDRLTIQDAFLKEILELVFPNATAGSKVTLSDLKSDTARQQRNQIRIQLIKSLIKKDLVTKGFFQVADTLMFSSAVVFLLMGILFCYMLRNIFPVAWPFLIFFGLCLFMLIFVYRRRTQVGYEALDHIKGFKLFLGMTEKERYEFHNAPEKSPEEFMKYLPYAIAFGVEKKWAAVFKDISIPNPDWYDGGSVGAFSAVNLTSSLGAFSSSFASSSGSSASSGGGSSGGGGGGGGGGSW